MPRTRKFLSKPLCSMSCECSLIDQVGLVTSSAKNLKNPVLVPSHPQQVEQWVNCSVHNYREDEQHELKIAIPFFRNSIFNCWYGFENFGERIPQKNKAAWHVTSYKNCCKKSDCNRNPAKFCAKCKCRSGY